MSVLRRAHVEVLPDTSKFDGALTTQLARADPGGKAGKQIGGQLNRALSRLSLAPIDVSADPRKALLAIDVTESRLRDLSNDAATVEVKVRTEQALGQLARFRRQLGDVGDDAGKNFGASIGVSTTQGLFASLSSAFKPPPPQLLAAVAGLGAAMAPVLGGVLAGAVIGGAGIGGVAGGIALAAKDQRVQAAAKNFADSVGGRLQDAALPFVDATMDGLSIIQQGFNGVAANVQNIFKNASTFVRPLASGVNDFLRPIVQGVDALVAKASPVIEALRRGLGEVGRAIGELFTSLADNGVEAGLAIEVVFKGIVGVVRTVGAVINGLTEAFGFLVRMADKLGFLSDEGKEKLGGLRGATDAMTGSAGAGKSSFDGFKKVIEETGKSTATATVKMRDYQAELQQLVSRNLSAAEANISLRAAIKSAADATDKKRRVSDAESTALIGMARAANTTTTALDEQGRTVKQATSAHEANRKKLIETAEKMGYTRTQAKRLADQYLAIPKGVGTRITQPGMATSQKETREYDKQLDNLARQIKTSVTVSGDRAAYAKLERLLIQQQALAKGTSISAAASSFRKQEAKAFHSGGYTGAGGKYDPAGVVHADEFVIKKESRQRIESRHPGLLQEMNATGQMPGGYAGGGRVINAPFRVNAGITKIMTLAEALSKVAPAFGNWPSSPGAQRGDSGVWRRIVALIRSTGPMSGSFGNAYRAGDPLWHGSGRAVDWMGYNQDGLARFLAAKRPLELIHRTKTRDYAYTRGVNKGSFNESLMNAHRNHVHIAMDDGGLRMLQPGLNVIPNFTGRPEPIAGPAAMAGMGNTYNINVAVPVGAHPAEVGRQTVLAIQEYERANGKRWRTP